MEALAFLRPLRSIVPPPSPYLQRRNLESRRLRLVVSGCYRPQSQSQMNLTEADHSRPSYKPSMFDDWLLVLFRQKMVEEVGWDSDKPGYNGLMEVVNRLMMKSQKDVEAQKAAVRVLRSLFPSWLLYLFKKLVSPLYGGKLAAMMNARVTAFSCQWLMGPCAVNAVEVPCGSSWSSGSFFGDYMGVPLTMVPNFTDYSCQFKFGVCPPLAEDDESLKEPCLQVCPNATRRRELGAKVGVDQCPKI